jgi:hypothetical protein
MSEIVKLEWKGCDGAKWGVSDWYEEFEKLIQEALNKGPSHNWTTGWYGSKKEIASACITHEDGKIKLEATQSDDFDTEGYGSVDIPHTTDIEAVREALDKAHGEACENKRDNEVYAGFSIHNAEGQWVETYIAPIGWGGEMESPPGDYYSEWGFQGDCELPKHVKDAIEHWIARWDCGVNEDDTQFTCDGWTVRPWRDD